MTVVLAIIDVKTPLIITASRHRNVHHDTERFIRDHSLKGAIARKFLLENVRNEFGNCKDLTGPDQPLRCNDCPEQSRCKYYLTWNENALQLSHALPYDWDLIATYPLKNLRTAARGRNRTNIIVDRLLVQGCTTLSLLEADKYSQFELIKEEMKAKIISDISADNTQPSIESENAFKGSKADGILLINEKRFVPEALKTVSYNSLAINKIFKSSAKGYLYGVTALAPGTRMTTVMHVNDEDPAGLKEAFNEGTSMVLNVGMGKSKNWGEIELTVKKTFEDDQFIEIRARQISESLFKINDLLFPDKKITPQSKTEWLFTLTLLSDFRVSEKIFEENQRVIDFSVLLSPIIPCQQLAAQHDVKRRLLTYQVNDEAGGEQSLRRFKVLDYIAMGSAFAFMTTESVELEELARKLAEFELNMLKQGHGTVCINHPFHWMFSTMIKHEGTQSEGETIVTIDRARSRERLFSKEEVDVANLELKALERAESLLKDLKLSSEPSSSAKKEKHETITRGIVRNLLQSSMLTSNIIEFQLQAHYHLARADIDKNNSLKEFWKRFRTNVLEKDLQGKSDEEQMMYLRKLLQYVVLVHVRDST